VRRAPAGADARRECWRRTSELKTAAVCAWHAEFCAKHPGVKLATFPHHLPLADAIEAAIKDRRPTVRIDGSTKDALRQQHIDALQAGAAEAGVLSLTACGAGITLCGPRGVSVIVIPELPWTPASVFQAIARAWRMGVTQEVQVYILTADGSFDADVFRTLKRKAAVSAAVVDDDEGEL